MKATLLPWFFGLLSLSAQSASLCKSVPEPSTCQEIVVPQPLEGIKGRCAGLLMNRFICQFAFEVTETSSVVKANCENFLDRKIFNETLLVTPTMYKSIGVVEEPTGEQRLISDEFLITNLSHDQVIMSIQDDRSGLIIQRQATIMFSMFGNMLPIQNVICE